MVEGVGLEKQHSWVGRGMALRKAPSWDTRDDSSIATVAGTPGAGKLMTSTSRHACGALHLLPNARQQTAGFQLEPGRRARSTQEQQQRPVLPTCLAHIDAADGLVVHVDQRDVLWEEGNSRCRCARAFSLNCRCAQTTAWWSTLISVTFCGKRGGMGGCVCVRHTPPSSRPGPESQLNDQRARVAVLAVSHTAAAHSSSCPSPHQGWCTITGS